MSRNGSGVYSLPAGLPTNGEVSNATDDILTPFQDIETDLNTARPVVVGGTGATSASAARTNLGLAIGSNVQAYSATLDALAAGGAAVPDASVTTAKIADSAVTSAKIADGTIATADIADDAVTDAKVLNPSGLVFISSQDASSSATLDFTGFDATKYDSYVFEGANLIPNTSTTLFQCRTSTDGGSTYDSGASDYSYGMFVMDMADAETPEYANAVAADGIYMTDDMGGSDVPSTAGSGFGFTLKLRGPHLAKNTMVGFEGEYEQGSGHRIVKGGGVRLSTADVDAIRFLFNSGNIASGTITMYGLRNS